MKKTLISAVLLLACIPSWAEWTYVGEGNGRRFYLDVASVRSEGGIKTAWTMIDMPPTSDPLTENIKKLQSENKRLWDEFKAGARQRAFSAYVRGTQGVPGTAARLVEETEAQDRIQEQEFLRREIEYTRLMRASQPVGPSGVLSVATKSEYDCKGMRIRRVTQNHYADAMASGEPVNSVGPSQNWAEVAPNSIVSTVANRICGGW